MHCPVGGLSNTNHPSISRDQLCITLPDPTLVAPEANLPRMTPQRTIHDHELAMNSDYRRGLNIDVPAIDGADRRATEDLQHVRHGRQVKLGPVETLSASESSMQYLTSIRSFCTAACGKPQFLSASVCVPPSYIIPSDVLETIAHSLSASAISDSDATFYTADE